MQEPQAPSSAKAPWWLYVVSAALVVFGVLFFFQTRDPMILLFGFVAAGMFWLVVHLMRGAAGPSGTLLRCPSCRNLNPGNARYCNQCGKEL